MSKIKELIDLVLNKSKISETHIENQNGLDEALLRYITSPESKDSKIGYARYYEYPIYEFISLNSDINFLNHILFNEVTNEDPHHFYDSNSGYYMYNKPEYIMKLTGYLDNVDQEGLILKDLINNLKSLPDDLDYGPVICYELPLLLARIDEELEVNPLIKLKASYHNEDQIESVASVIKSNNFKNSVACINSYSLYRLIHGFNNGPDGDSRFLDGFITNRYFRSLDVTLELTKDTLLISKNNEFFLTRMENPKNEFHFEKLEGLKNISGHEVDFSDSKSAYDKLNEIFTENEGICKYRNLNKHQALDKLIERLQEEIRNNEHKSLYELAQSYNKKSVYYKERCFLDINKESQEFISETLSKFDRDLFKKNDLGDIQNACCILNRTSKDGQIHDIDFERLYDEVDGETFRSKLSMMFEVIISHSEETNSRLGDVSAIDVLDGSGFKPSEYNLKFAQNLIDLIEPVAEKLDSEKTIKLILDANAVDSPNICRETKMQYRYPEKFDVLRQELSESVNKILNNNKQAKKPKI